MKKLTLLLLTLLALTLTACGNASDSTEAASPSQTDPSAQTLSGPNLLAIGTLKLKDTSQTVTPDQAAELLPLWQVYQSLSASDNAAQEEIDALVKQIEETMTADQMQAINNLGLTQQDMFATMQELGVAMGGGGRPSGNGNSNDGNFMPPGDSPSPDMGGGMPGQGPGGGGEGLNPSQIATAQASRGAGGTGGDPNRVMPALLEALIKYLQEVAGSR